MKKIIISLLLLCSFLTFTDCSFAYQAVKKNSYHCNQSLLRKYNDPVVYNAKSHIYHETWCQWALKSTENGYYMERSEASMKGRPCKVCH